MKKVFFILALLIVQISSNANISITSKAPSTVAVGEQFRLQYSVNTNVSTEPQIKSISGFRILYGPAISTSQSIQSINGHITQSSSTVFTFTLSAEKEGTYVLPAISLNIGSKTYTSNRVRVRVTKTNSGTNKSSNNRQQYNVPQVDNSSDSHNISPSELYITTTANKHEVYEQEPVLLSYNVYTNLMLEQLMGKMPDLKGFVAKEIPLPKQKHLTVTKHNGRTTQTTTWSQYVMFPQQSGKLVVPSIKFEGTILFPNRNLDPVDAFFFGSNVVNRVNHVVNAPSVNIVVKPLPKRPLDFSGAVGHNFSITSKLLTKKIRENELFNIQVVINGIGNLDLVSPPTIKFPVDFETYDPSTNVKADLTSEGMKGQIIINYSAIPNHKGNYVIPPIHFVYFDPNDAKYHTISTNAPINIHVEKGSPNSYAARERLKDNDIEPIHLSDKGKFGSNRFWLSPIYLCINIVLLLLIVFHSFILNYLKKFLKHSHLFGTKSSIKELPNWIDYNNPTEFYVQLLLCLKKFIIKKTKYQDTEITSEQICELLKKHNLAEKEIEETINFIKECEYRAYGSSTQTTSDMQSMYEEAKNIIGNLDKRIKKITGKSKTINFFILAFALSFLCVPSNGNILSKTQADSLYNQHHYEEAQEVYLKLLKSKPNDSNLLYNLGNCFYKQKNIPKAILYYERALKINPSDMDIHHNLTLSRAQTVDKFYSATDLELIYSFNSFVNMLSVDEWAIVSVLSLCLITVIVFNKRFSKAKKTRRLSSILIVVLFICILCSNIVAYIQYQRFNDKSYAIIMTTTPLRSTPEKEGTILFTLHGGTKVKLTDTTLPLWSEVQLSDGRQGWILNKSKENISLVSR